MQIMRTLINIVGVKISQLPHIRLLHKLPLLDFVGVGVVLRHLPWHWSWCSLSKTGSSLEGKCRTRIPDKLSPATCFSCDDILYLDNRSELQKTNHGFLAFLCDLFGMVSSRDPFKGCW